MKNQLKGYLIQITDEIGQIDTNWNREDIDEHLWEITHKYKNAHTPEYKGKKLILWNEGHTYIFDFNKKSRDGKLNSIYKWTHDYKFGDTMKNIYRRHWWN